ncbi:MAG: Uridine phosphorylase, partial [uncultured Thermomicrobiales bacterium]
DPDRARPARRGHESPLPAARPLRRCRPGAAGGGGGRPRRGGDRSPPRHDLDDRRAIPRDALVPGRRPGGGCPGGRDGGRGSPCLRDRHRSPGGLLRPRHQRDGPDRRRLREGSSRRRRSGARGRGGRRPWCLRRHQGGGEMQPV